MYEQIPGEVVLRWGDKSIPQYLLPREVERLAYRRSDVIFAAIWQFQGKGRTRRKCLAVKYVIEMSWYQAPEWHGDKSNIPDHRLLSKHKLSFRREEMRTIFKRFSKIPSDKETSSSLELLRDWISSVLVSQVLLMIQPYRPTSSAGICLCEPRNRSNHGALE